MTQIHTVYWTANYTGVKRSPTTGPSLQFEQVLSENVDLSELKGAKVFLEPGSRKLLGLVEEVWVEDDIGLARIKFSQREDVAGYVQDVADGVLNNFRADYCPRVEGWRKDEYGFQIATRWKPSNLYAFGGEE